MKKYLLGPSANWYRANLHCHTVHSDGALTPQEVKDLYKSRGYSVVAYSDHERFVPHNELTDGEFVAINSAEYGFSLGIPSRLPQPSGLKNVWATERCFHFNVFALDASAADAPDREAIYALQKGLGQPSDEPPAARLAPFYAAINEWIARCRREGFLVQLNHPYWSLNVSEDWLSLKGLWSLEILNYATQRETGAEYCPMVHDEMLRHGGPGLFCTMDDDNHNRPALAFEEHSFGGSTFFAADELSYEAIADSMKAGRFFCASGFNPPRFHSVWIEGRRVHAEFSPVDIAMLTCFGRCFKQVRGAGIASADFDVPEGEPYFRLTLIDRQGNFANTGAFAIEPPQG